MRRALAFALFALMAALAQKPVVATIRPYGLLLRELAGGRLEVAVLVPPSANPHVYEPTPAQVRQVAGARLVVANGAGLDGWVVDKVVRPNALGTPIFFLAEHTGEPLLTTPTGPDPHVWLDPLRVAGALPALAEALAQADPQGAALYRTRAVRLRAELERLDQEMRGLLAERKRPGVITLRNPFRYFTARYGVPILYTIVPNPEAPEATAKAAAEAKKVAQEKGIRHVLAPLAAKGQALPLAQNLGLEAILADVLGEEAKTYPELVRKVAEAFAQALR
ncbi:metal ABC transporter substrate-binding protein [Thermus tengchongensis]|uniref:Zinc ABC transporter substrate-binding protein n=1 Tax=Thermus tengchongensis TaxID=1214928 RepID=A0ABY2K4B7_9DEIN|nr:metal ABC transporter substrate-binding protein [Thermus tengchongensis]TFU15054.1 zinc ABC transporter substrate-binding protein [Thermus tengchongensis]